jgi:hypothetical protein
MGKIFLGKEEARDRVFLSVVVEKEGVLMNIE